MEAIIHLELELTVEFDAQKEERATSHYPGCPAAVGIDDIKILGKEISDSLYDEIIRLYEDEIEEACWEEIKEG